MGCILLSGIAGFIGSHLAESLLRGGWAVRGIDAFTETYEPRQKRDNLAELSRSPMVELITGDLARDDLRTLVDGVDAVVHLAGEPGVPASWGTAFPTYVERNIIATQRLLEAASAAGVSRFVYASSSSVYGPENRPLVESAVPRPVSPYGASKLAGEVLVGAYAQERGLSTVALRYFSVYGPRQRPDMAAHRFIEALLDHRPLLVYGDGRQARDFTYVADVVAATSAALTASVPTGSVLNVARGDSVEVRDLIAILAEELRVEPSIEHRPTRAGDTPRTEGCADAARHLLGWEPATDLRSGLRRQADWHVRRRLERGVPVPQDTADAPSFAVVPAPSGAPGRSESVEGGQRRTVARPPVNGSREPRLLIYSQDGFGLGHQRRTTLLADEFLRTCPGASALTVSDSPLGRFFSSVAGHDYCKLPSVRKVGPGDWQPVSLSSSFADVLDVRREVLRTTVQAFRPDVLLVDHMPHGAMGELVPTLDVLQDEPTAVVLGLRDILDAPHVVRERWRLEGAYEAVERYYDRVLVYGSSDLFDVATEYDWPDGARSKIQYCGYVCAPRSPEVAEPVRFRYLGTAAEGRLVVAMAGGGADAYPLFDALLSAVPLIQDAGPCHFVLITGPFLPAEQRHELTARAQDLPADVLISVSDPMRYAASADLVVAMAGYNTTAEILSVGTPALLVPRPGPSAEQQMRARLFAERGWVHSLRPQDLDAESLGGAVTAALHQPWATTPVRPPDLAGRRAAADRLIESLTETRPHQATPVAANGTALRRSVAGLRDDDYLLA